MAKKAEGSVTKKAEELKGQTCPVCGKKTLSLMEAEEEVPFFGKVYLFSMNCSDCKYHKADIESLERKEPCRYTIEISDEKDMHIRVVKSSEATVKIPHVGSIEPGLDSNGYITNVEGILNRFKKIIEDLKESAEEKEEIKKAKNLLKKITKITWGQEKVKLIIEDPSGNSAIISDKTEKTKLKR